MLRPDTASDNSPERSRRRSGWGLVRFIGLLLLLAWALRSFVIAPFSIPTGSMVPTLLIGDYVMVAKWPYGYSQASMAFGIPPFEGRLLAKLPKRGDVVVFRPPGADQDFIKRVIGLPGDTIELRGGMLLVNGRAFARRSAPPVSVAVTPNSPCRVVPPAQPFTVRTADGTSYCLYSSYHEGAAGQPGHRVIDQVENPRADDIPPLRVPEGNLFMMGDNRDDSLDSRFTVAEGGVGMIPLESLIGRASIIFWSTDGSASYWKPWTWFTALRTDRLGLSASGLEE